MHVNTALRLWVSGATVMALGVSAGASAHHSYAEFDRTNLLSMNGTIAKVEMKNPHSFVWLYGAKKPDGSHDLYGFENGSAAMLRRFGWKDDTLAAGEKVTVRYFPLRDGRKGGYFVGAVHADGRITEGDPYAPGGSKEAQAPRSSVPKGVSIDAPATPGAAK
jgi:hypothetical protein